MFSNLKGMKVIYFSGFPLPCGILIMASFWLTKSNANVIGITTITPPATILSKKFVSEDVIIFNKFNYSDKVYFLK